MTDEEVYVINGHRCYIDIHAGGYRVWTGGNQIGGAYQSLDAARGALHAYMISKVRAEYHGHQERMVGADRALGKLGGDPCNLGWFRQRSADLPPLTALSAGKPGAES